MFGTALVHKWYRFWYRTDTGFGAGLGHYKKNQDLQVPVMGVMPSPIWD